MTLSAQNKNKCLLPEVPVKVLVIGAGLAGSEAAFFLANKGIKVILVESKKTKPTPAQKMATAGELVCTNSLKSLDPETGHGILKVEMEALGSLVLKAAHLHRVPAGQALAVDRELFSKHIHEQLVSHPNIRFIDEEVTDPAMLMAQLECSYSIVATGPLTSENLEKWILENLSRDDFYFYDAIAPVVDAESLDMSKLYFKDRYGEVGVGDYLNAPMNKEEYLAFIAALVAAEKVQPKNFEELKYFEACLPIDTMAMRGVETARFSCMKPVGLAKDEKGLWPYAVVQLRKENLLGSAYNMVGFQTRLTYKEQTRVFRMIPGFENAEFIHLGSCHRNSFLNAKKLLNSDLSSQKFPQIYFAGQITGVEGYTESSAMGLMAATQVWAKIQGKHPLVYPVASAFGALLNYIMTSERPAPSSINMGLFPEPSYAQFENDPARTKALKKSERKELKKMLIKEQAFEAFKGVLESLSASQP